MPHIQLSDELFLSAKQRAAESGFESVDDFVSNLVQDAIEYELPEDFFTPERLALIDESVAKADQGLCFTREQSDAILARKRQAWLDQQKS